MKTRYWVILFAGIACVCVAAMLFMKGSPSKTAQVFSDGTHIMTIDLATDAEYRIAYGEEWNILSVKDGKVSVSSASCASQDCVRHGAVDSGAPIVCLPNRLVIRFTETVYDAILS